MTSSKPDGIPTWAWIVVSITVATIGAYGVIEASRKSSINVPSITSLSPTPNVSSTLPSVMDKHCIGSSVMFLQNITLNQSQNQYPFNASVIYSIWRDYSASLSQLQVGDMITSANGENITNESTLREQVQRSNEYIVLKIIRPSHYYFGDHGRYISYSPYNTLDIKVSVVNGQQCNNFK